MHKTAIFSLSLIVLLLMGTTLNMNMFSTANAQRIGQYDNSYQQSTYGEPYPSNYDASYSYDKKHSYDKPRIDDSQSLYSDKYSQYKTENNKYECRTGPFEGFFVSSVEFCKNVKFDKDDRKDHRDK